MLAPILMSSGGSNDTKFNDKEFDTACTAILSASNDDEIKDKVAKAEEILQEKLPSIPLWNGNFVGGYSKNVSDVYSSWNGTVEYYLIKK